MHDNKSKYQLPKIYLSKYSSRENTISRQLPIDIYEQITVIRT